MNIFKGIGTGIVLTGIISFNAWAGNVTIPNTFTSNTAALASEVNANFTAVKTAVDGNATDIISLQAAVATLQTALTAATNRITALETISSVLTIDTDNNGYPRALFSGVNVQVVNGLAQGTPNGAGNLIVGYNNARTGTAICSDGQYANQFDCENNSETWVPSHKSGSHNLVAGNENSYSQTGGVVFGNQNAINRLHASISGGTSNTASGVSSSISGGLSNTTTAIGGYNSISGGESNVASGDWSSISGGGGNIASGAYSSVSGGDTNTAYANVTSVCGGTNNTAGDNSDATHITGNNSTISGGRNNTTTGIYSSIGGGNGRTEAATDGLF